MISIGFLRKPRSMNTKTLVGLLASFWVIVLIAGCFSGCSESQPKVLNTPNSPVIQQATVEQHSSTNQSIRSTDFSNSTFPWVNGLGDSKTNFTLRNGELTETRDEKGRVKGMGVILESVAYGDVTGDSDEEAMVVLSVITGGSSIPHIVYIYTLQDERVRLLWAFSTGDRADGGLRQLYAQNGELVIEQYSKVGSKGDCCPTLFTRTHFQWRGGRFQQRGKEETLPNPSGNGSLVMPPFKHSE